MNKNLKILLIILGVVIVGGLIFLVFQTQKSIKDDVEIEGLENNKKGMSEVNFKDFEGKWIRLGSNQFDQSIIKINNVNSENFTFEIDAFSGTHEGGLSGVANINGNKAFFKDKEFEINAIFTIENDTLILEGENLEIYSGAGIGLSGKYKKNLEIKELTLVDVKVLNESQEKEFKNLVGEDYELFKNWFYFTQEENDLDSIGAKVYSGGLRGFLSAGIIMIISENKFVAAIVDNNKANYYTNIEEYKNLIPKTIKHWAKDLPIEIKN